MEGAVKTERDSPESEASGANPERTKEQRDGRQGGGDKNQSWRGGAKLRLPF